MINTKHNEFIFCNDPVCEADEAVDYLNAKIEVLEAKIKQQQKTIDFKDKRLIQQDKEYLKLKDVFDRYFDILAKNNLLNEV
jgi:uncharacterized coiled-coil protein SlyX